MPTIINLTPAQEQRFWARVVKSDGCWICNLHPSGTYARMGINGKHWCAHVVSYILANGFLEDGKSVCHSCDTPRCVRPDHLFAKTHAENMQEMVQRKRNKPMRGQMNPMSKISDATALGIRTTVSSGAKSVPEWAKELSVSEVAIYNCLSGRTFAHVGGPRVQSNDREIPDEMVIEMRRLAANGVRNVDIAKQFGMHQATCSNYIHGWKRKDLPGAIPPRVRTPKPPHVPRVIKFTPEVIQDIRESRRRGVMYRVLAEKYDTRVDVIQAIVSGKRGKSVPVGDRVINQNPCKHTPEVQQEILRRNQAGETQISLAREYGMSKNGINLLLQRLSA